GSGFPRARQQFDSAHSRHVDVGEDENEPRSLRRADALQSLVRGLREFHGEARRAQLLAELLAEEFGDIGLIVDDQNQRAHDPAPERGRTMVNCVKAPASVETSSIPPCCLTTMSWLIERPRPVPSPAGLVVKNGLNIFAFTSAGMPVPLSRMAISTLFPRSRVEAMIVGSQAPFGSLCLRFVVA